MTDVFMDDVNTNSMPYNDALRVFWPGLQALMGDLKPAIVYHQVLNHMHKRYGFIPEEFDGNLKVKIDN